MHLTVEEALTIYPLSHAKLVAGEKGISRILRSVNVIDCPDICDWVKSGEMLFTTAFVMKDKPELALTLLRTLNERGASGLGIKVGRFWDEIPEEIAMEANRLNFPILALPYEFTFSDQMDALFNAEHVKTTKKLHGVLEKQKQLMQFALRQIDHANIFHIISGILTQPIAIVGSRGNVLFNNSQWTNESILHQWPWQLNAQWEGFSEERCFRIPLADTQGNAGFLKVFINYPMIMKEEEALFHQAAEILTYHLGLDIQSGKEPSRQQALADAFNDFFQRELSFRDFMKICQDHKLKLLNSHYQCVLTTVSPNHPHAEKLMNEVRQELIYNPLLQLYESEHVYIKEGMFSIYALPEGETFQKDDFVSTLSSCIVNMVRTGASEALHCWVSRMKERPESIYDAYKECIQTSQIAPNLGLNQSVIENETVEMFSVFQHLSPDTMKGYCEHLLEPVFGKDKMMDQELVQTLEVFMAYDGSINETSRHLFIHRNTVSYRLEKIGDLLQLDFKKMNDLLRLKLAFLFRSYLKNVK
jgi:purine catabolism regulator